MIHITDKQNCCGCSACVLKCPKQCITLHEDKEGFLYPKVDTDNCIECGLCEKVCPTISPYDSRKPLQVFAAMNKDEKVRMQSSSGGIFSLIAENVIRNGGVVFGAKFDRKWEVILDYTETIEGLNAFRGSKYVQARVGDTYKKCEEFLKDGRFVLFTGTPCQVAGLQHYLRKDYETLTTCDFVCHGTPSPLIWREYLSYLSRTTLKNVKYTNISFRDKTEGWRNFSFKIEGINECENNMDPTEKVLFRENLNQNLYMLLFLKNLILRPSCYNCHAKQGRSTSDITIADFWGIDEVLNQVDDDRGVSLVLIHSERMRQQFSSLVPDALRVEYDLALKNNICIEHSVVCTEYRKKFWAQYNRKGFRHIEWIYSDLKPTILYRIIQRIKRTIK